MKGVPKQKRKLKSENICSACVKGLQQCSNRMKLTGHISKSWWNLQLSSNLAFLSQTPVSQDPDSINSQIHAQRETQKWKEKKNSNNNNKWFNMLCIPMKSDLLNIHLNLYMTFHLDMKLFSATACHVISRSNNNFICKNTMWRYGTKPQTTNEKIIVCQIL